MDSVSPRRPRNIVWSSATDRVAVNLARDAGKTVSDLLEALVLQQEQTQRPLEESLVQNILKEIKDLQKRVAFLHKHLDDRKKGNPKV